VLKGGIETLRKFKPILLVELYDPWCKKFGYSAKDVLKLMTSLNYQCYFASNGVLSLKTKIENEEECYNYFFLHNQKHSKLINELGIIL